MNLRDSRILSAALALSTTFAALPAIAGPAAEAFHVELWMVELPEVPPNTTPSSFPAPGRLEFSNVDADTWLNSVGGADMASTHLLLALTDSEEFSIELPKLGCAFHGTAFLEDGLIRFNVVTVDNPERPMPDCAFRELAVDLRSTAAAGRSSARETQVAVTEYDTLIFTPADRGDGCQRLIVWRTLPN